MPALAATTALLCCMAAPPCVLGTHRPSLADYRPSWHLVQQLLASPLHALGWCLPPRPVRCTTNVASRLCLAHPGLVPLPFSWDRPGPCLVLQGPTASAPLWIRTGRNVVPTHPSSAGHTVDLPRPLRTAVSALPAMVLSHGAGPWPLLPAATARSAWPMTIGLFVPC
ncbi:hypothetical protein V6N13_007791 [Hibiscus sabdariffa]|uniref:Secreted protein n=1 Tax=Hibiscus sabdariffa TaxID=183260 RepID=A0ABR2EN18_9ROSI